MVFMTIKTRRNKLGKTSRLMLREERLEKQYMLPRGGKLTPTSLAMPRLTMLSRPSLQLTPS
jgi:hypothetical protein